MNPGYRILSFDGGGIRGLLSLVLLERLEASLPGWLASVDLLAGTSTGGIIALGLAHGVPVGELRRVYEERGKRIFDDAWKLPRDRPPAQGTGPPTPCPVMGQSATAGGSPAVASHCSEFGKSNPGLSPADL